jgi:hypothetical protein
MMMLRKVFIIISLAIRPNNSIYEYKDLEIIEHKGE